jgi:hypothetical protein
MINKMNVADGFILGTSTIVLVLMTFVTKRVFMLV